MQRIFTSFCILFALIFLVACSSSPKKTAVVKAVTPSPVLAKPNLKPEQQQLYNSGIDALRNQNYEQASSTFSKLIELYPNLAGAYVNLGIIFELQEKIPEALDAYEKALQINPSNVDALLQLGLLHMKRGRFGLSEQRLLSAERINEDHPLVQFNLGVLYELYLQDFDEAIEHYENYVELSDDDDVATVKRWIKLLERK